MGVLRAEFCVGVEFTLVGDCVDDLNLLVWSAPRICREDEGVVGREAGREGGC